MEARGTITRLDSKGRLTIPLEIRRKLGLEPGAQVYIREEKGRIVVELAESTAEKYYKSIRVKKWPRDIEEEIRIAVAESLAQHT